MPNFFVDNIDMRLIFEQLNLSIIVEYLENNFQTDKDHIDVLKNYEEAMEYYRDSLELMGDICGNQIAPRRLSVDAEGTQFHEGEVFYARGTEQSRRQLSEAGFMGAILPREYGGAHIPSTIYMMLIELVSRADASLMTMFGYQDVGELIARFGTQQQKKSYIPRLASGEDIGAIVLTEPAAGSDLQAIRLKAYQNDEGQWFLKGTKQFISNGCGDVLMVLARSEENSQNIFGLSLFICRGGNRVKVNRVEEKMGLHGSPTCELFFDDAPVELIGKRRMGLTKYILESLSQARFSVAAQALGIAQGAYESALDYAKQRVQFGKLIIDIPAVANMLIQMQTELDACRNLLYFAVYFQDLKVQMENYIDDHKATDPEIKSRQKELRKVQVKLNLLSPMVKYFVTEAANRICLSAQQVYGGMGYIKETGMEQYVRDVRITTIYEGTSQVQVSASIKSVVADVLTDFFEQHENNSEQQGSHYSQITELRQIINHTREIFLEIKEYFSNKNDEQYLLSNAQSVVDCYTNMITGHIMLDAIVEFSEEIHRKRKILLAKRHILQSLAQAKAIRSVILNDVFLDLDNKDILLA